MPQYYPSLSSLIPLDKLPEELDFIKVPLQDFFDDIYYQDYIFNRSADGATFSYQLTLLVPESIEWGVPGTGLLFKLNSNYTGNSSAGALIPLTLTFHLGILKYVDAKKIKSFLATVQELYKMVFEIIEITDEKLIKVLAKRFFHKDGANPLNELAENLNSQNIPKLPSGTMVISTPVSSNDDTAINAIITAVKTTAFSVKDLVYTKYIDDINDLTEKLRKFNTLFSEFSNKKPEDLIKELFIPDIYAAVNVVPSIQFPSGFLKAIDNNDEIILDVNNNNEELKVEMAFNPLEDLSYSTKAGFGFPKTVAITIKNPPAPMNPVDKIGIMNTGIMMDINDAKLDLSKKTTLPEAAALGYGPTFKGIVIDSVSIFLPKEWTPSSGSISLVGKNIVVGAEEDGDMEFSGHIGLAAPPTLAWFEFFNGQIKVRLDTFGLSFVRNEVTATFITGKIQVVGVKDKNNPANDIEVDVEVTFHREGFEVCFSNTNGVAVTIPNVADLVLKKIRIGCDGLDDNGNRKWYCEISVMIDLLFSFPFADKFLPDYINLYPLFLKQGESPDFNIEINWAGGAEAIISSDGGLSFEKTMVINKTIGEILKIELLKYKIKGEADGTLTTKVLGSGSFKLGPASGSVQDTGIQAIITFPGNNTGNLGPVDAKLSFVPPNGIGVSIDNNVISGGGFVNYNSTEKSFRGIISLKIKNIAITGIAVLDTKMPDGSKGMSLVILLFTEFPDIPIGFGFNLQGVGGILGFNRTVITQKIRDGLQGTQLDNLLFPENPVAKATAIISEIETVFPTKKGNYLVGPMAKISWGSPALITGKLGLLVEFPDPFTVIIIGNIQANLPKSTQNIKLKVNFLGVVDFNQKLFSFDAYLYDSTITGYVLTGGMALRVKWGDQPNFVLSVGGFHPAYTPPPLNIPALPRVAISMSSSDVEIRAQAYFAITSNSVQVGCRIDAKAKVWELTASGYLFCDTLILFNPFRFTLTAGMGISVKFKGKTITSIQVDFVLEGPRPWHAIGSAEVKVLRMSHTINFELTIGDPVYEAPVTIDILPDLLLALQNKNNWEAIIPGQNNQNMVVLKDIPNAAANLVLHPNGGLKVTQNVVPLDRTISKYGNATPKDYTYFNLVNPQLGTLPAQAGEYLMGSFAAGDFEYLNEHQKLTRPAYEPFKNGMRIKAAASENVYTSYYVRNQVSFETTYMDVRKRKSPKITMPVSTDLVDVHTQDYSATQSVLSHKNNGISSTAPPATVVNDDSFVVIEKSAASAVDNKVFSSYYDALQYLNAKEQADPNMEGAYKVISEFELA